MNANSCSGRTLAFLGDAVWSLMVREYLIENGKGKGKTLQKDSIAMVSAKSQAAFYDALHEANILTEEEEAEYSTVAEMQIRVQRLRVQMYRHIVFQLVLKLFLAICS